MQMALHGLHFSRNKLFASKPVVDPIDALKETPLKDSLGTKIYSEAVEHQLQQLKTTEEQVRSQDASTVTNNEFKP